MFSSNPPLGLYIHLPWCEQKCPYCDFNSHQAESIPERDYVDALLQDLETDLPLVWGRRIESIFIGGGTPSLFSAEAIERLFSGLRSLLNFAPSIEITMESNPGSADAANYRGYREAGVNRLSIGIQSFDDQQLANLGNRGCRHPQAERAEEHLVHPGRDAKMRRDHDQLQDNEGAPEHVGQRNAAGERTDRGEPLQDLPLKPSRIKRRSRVLTRRHTSSMSRT